MNRLFQAILAFSLVLPSAGFAGTGSGLAEIEAVGGYSNGQIVFLYTTNHINAPSCNTYRQRWVLDISTSSGKQQYALLLSAQLSGKQVVIWGTNNCSLWVDQDSEGVFSVGYVVTHP